MFPRAVWIVSYFKQVFQWYCLLFSVELNGPEGRHGVLTRDCAGTAELCTGRPTTGHPVTAACTQAGLALWTACGFCLLLLSDGSLLATA